MAAGQLVTCDWAWVRTLAALLASPSVNLPLRVFASTVDRVPLDTDGMSQWPLPGSVLLPSPMNLDLEFLWTVTGSDLHSRYVSTPVQEWTGALAPSLPYTIRALCYYSAPAPPSARLMGVVRLPAPVVLVEVTDSYTYLPTWPVRSGVTTG